MESKWANRIGAVIAALALIVGTTIVVHPAVSELAGIAVAVTQNSWNNVVDASKGDGLSSGILGSSNYLFNGLTFDRMRSAPAGDGAAGTGFIAQVVELYNGTTYDRMRGGLTADANAVTGLTTVQLMSFNGTTYDRVRSAIGDGQTATGFLANANLIFNGGTWDREHNASADNLTATGLPAAGNMGFDGSAWDRVISVSNTNNTAVTSQGARYTTPLSTWNVTSTATAGTPSASKASGGGSVRHVATSITVCVAAAATPQPAVQVNLRDGASGAGTIIRSWALGAVVNSGQCSDLGGLNMSGSAATAMTLEFAGATAAGVIGTVTLSGYSTP